MTERNKYSMFAGAISHDYPPEVRQIRKDLLVYFKRNREAGMTVTLKYDKSLSKILFTLDDPKRANQAELEETDEAEEENVEGSEQVPVSREEKKKERMRETKPKKKLL